MYVPFFPQSGFGFLYVAVLYLASFKVFARRCFAPGRGGGWEGDATYERGGDAHRKF